MNAKGNFLWKNHLIWLFGYLLKECYQIYNLSTAPLNIFQALTEKKFFSTLNIKAPKNLLSLLSGGIGMDF